MASLTGFLLSKKVGVLVGERAEIIGGVILIIIGLRILLSHIL
jgi:putative Mn2+ efflux pump MntP